MAQHYSLIHTSSPIGKPYQKILDSIKNRLKRGIVGISGSLKFEELPKQCRVHPDERVFITERRINGQPEIFEIHYDVKEKQIIDVFLVI